MCAFTMNMLLIKNTTDFGGTRSSASAHSHWCILTHSMNFCWSYSSNRQLLLVTFIYMLYHMSDGIYDGFLFWSTTFDCKDTRTSKLRQMISHGLCLSLRWSIFLGCVWVCLLNDFKNQCHKFSIDFSRQ